MTETRQEQRSKKSDDYAHLEPLFAELARLEPDDPRRSEARDELVTGYLPLAEHIARRYSGKGIAKDDLVQVASVGLIHAVDRFDPSKGSDFLSFAVPTVMGEVRRHFRDTTWPMRVPRRLQELRLSLNNAGAELSQRLGRPPTEAELAEHLGVTEREVLEGLEARQAYRPVSLDESPFESDGRLPLAETMGDEDASLEFVENHESLAPLIQELPERERKILALRYFGDMTQTQIAEEIGISQMHVSRLLSRTLNELREELADSMDR
ncbi:SigB/SigF/SigG family RNA polymerase sigma factor [Glycomyces scopariae]|uniref:RNA polymerase sigma-B factor n=1 Tax=Glycomyces sambucus TaxID=380244 RepID=A0A1G9HYR5_9ACTN|nr:SigB/SigF/SigG family RNA polymerase sigma factor [Glycomyces sambucus]SDL17804.1 RNA polymerase sigma-B factor [Glycomyces sambucus]